MTNKLENYLNSGTSSNQKIYKTKTVRIAKTLLDYFETGKTFSAFYKGLKKDIKVINYGELNNGTKIS